MCLIVDREKTKSFSSSKHQTYTFYKTFNIENNCLRSPVLRIKIPLNFRDFIKAKGSININKKIPFLSEDAISIENGAVHAYTKYKKPLDFQITIPIQVNSSDVIAFGILNDVCFFKYKILNNTWKKIHLFVEKQNEKKH